MWNPEVEALPREQLTIIQLERLRATLRRVLDGIPLFAERVRAAGVSSPQDVASLDDIARLPFSDKNDLRQCQPFGPLAVPRADVARVHAAADRGGGPVLCSYTQGDLDTWSEVMARCLAAAGVGPGALVHNAFAYGLSTAGIAIHRGAERVGASLLPVSAGLAKRQAMMLSDMGSDVLCCPPSFALTIAQAVADAGADPASLKLRVGLFGGEPWTFAMRDVIERRFGLKALDLYGITEIIGLGVAGECIEARDGCHVHEDHFLPEIVDPETGAPLPPGALGELVLTTLTKEATPLIRFRTGDITALNVAPCVCGRTSVRLARLRGRYRDRLSSSGPAVYPWDVERILLATGVAAPNYQIALTSRPDETNSIVVSFERAADAPSDGSLAPRVKRALEEGTGLTLEAREIAPGGLPRSEGRAERIVRITSSRSD